MLSFKQIDQCRLGVLQFIVELQDPVQSLIPVLTYRSIHLKDSGHFLRRFPDRFQQIAILH